MTDSTDPGVIPDAEVKAPPSTEPTPDVPAEKPDEEAKAEDTAEAKTEEEVPKKSSGYARLKARHQALLAQLESLKTPQPQAEREPKPEDFNGDYLAYEKAAVAHAARQAIREGLSEARQQDFKVREAESRQETIQDFFERTEEAKSTLKDFDSAIDTMYGQLGPLPNVLRDKIAEADNGPQILYYLAKNPGVARDLYNSGPLDAVYEIGKLDQRMSVPSARKSTKAPPPITSPSGGAAPPRDLHQLAAKSEDISDYIKARTAK
jgi:hypothetical protein